jgi:hypothetical protein
LVLGRVYGPRRQTLHAERVGAGMRLRFNLKVRVRSG